MRSHWLDEWESQLDDEVENFNERAAIMEFDGGIDRLEAEQKALAILREKHPEFMQTMIDIIKPSL